MYSVSSSPTSGDNAAEILWSDLITAYDRAHLFTYARLLDAEAAGASRRQMMEGILGLDAQRAASDGQLSLHLARARWMRKAGYRQLLSENDSAYPA